MIASLVLYKTYSDVSTSNDVSFMRMSRLFTTFKYIFYKVVYEKNRLNEMILVISMQKIKYLRLYGKLCGLGKMKMPFGSWKCGLKWPEWKEPSFPTSFFTLGHFGVPTQQIA